MTKTTESKWRALIEEQEARRQTVREFAAERGLSPSTLFWWRSRRKRPVDPSGQLRARRNDSPA